MHAGYKRLAAPTLRARNPPQAAGLSECGEETCLKGDRGREGLAPSPPSEPCMRFSRTRLSSRWFPQRDWLASARAATLVNSPLRSKESISYLPPMTPFPAPPTCARSPPRLTRPTPPCVSAPCLTLAGTPTLRFRFASLWLSRIHLPISLPSERFYSPLLQRIPPQRCRVGGGAPCGAGLRPPLKLHVRFSRMQLSRR